ncbi:hypothetical protein JNUCC0626_18485 [Lentzea sp. JNUCC 0626]|uniref:hypothetical protein n=1 Tax=Lentzea sp. JNUCC 0626 TaxID=3367513 RepID=UPI003748AEDB
MSVRIWKDPDSDALRIQYDGEDGPLYEVADGDAPGDEVDSVPGNWVDMEEVREERTIPVSRLRALADFLEDQAKRGAFFTPRGLDGERLAGAQALADTAGRIHSLIHTGDFT